MIYVDVSAAVHSRAGLGRYSLDLARALVDARPENIALFYNQGRDGFLPKDLSGLPQHHVRLDYKPWRLTLLLANAAKINLSRLVPGVTLFHSTEHLLMPLGQIPTVLTVHDLIFKLFPDYHKRLNYWYLNLAMPLFCRRANALIAVSEASKRDIVNHYDIDPAKIHVVYEAAAEHFQPATARQIEEVRKAYSLPDRFLVHLSTIEPRKNLDRLLKALMILRQVDENLQLVLVGAKGWLYNDFFARIEAEGLQEVVKPLGWVPDEDLPAVIGAASLAVQPSLYEGFGLPILEHMACGQVVAASDSSSHPEVGGNAAAYFKATETDEMVAVIGRLLVNKDEYDRRRELGLKQAAKFSWRKTAEQTLAIYDRLIAKNDN